MIEIGFENWFRSKMTYTLFLGLFRNLQNSGSAEFAQAHLGESGQGLELRRRLGEAGRAWARFQFVWARLGECPDSSN